MSALTTRDALAEALHGLTCHKNDGASCGEADEYDYEDADLLLASGAVVDVATLANDDALQGAFASALSAHDPGNGRIFYGSTARLVRSLAAAAARVLSERSSR